MLGRTEAIILSMTPKERENPGILNASRKRRIAAGCGLEVVDVNRLLKQFEMMQQLTRSFQGKCPRAWAAWAAALAEAAAWAGCTALAAKSVSNNPCQ